jgi:hypothetical protein
MVDVAAELDRRPHVDRALAAGTIDARHAAVIAAALDELPGDIDSGVVAEAETALLDFAERFEAGRLRRLGARILDHIAPQVTDEADRVALERAERRTRRRRGLTLGVPVDGAVRVTGVLTVEDAAVVQAAFDPLCTPRPGDDRSPGQRRADALVDICQLALRTGTLPENGGEPAQLVVTVPYDVLTGRLLPADPAGSRPDRAAPTATGRGRPSSAGRDGNAHPACGVGGAASSAGSFAGRARSGPDRSWPGGATVGGRGEQAAPDGLGGAVLGGAVLDTGERVSAEAVRRLACDAQILPVVLGGAGQPLDVGRSRRLYLGPVRRALVVRDRGCAFPFCDRPARWCDAHHIVSWYDGGVTSVANGVLLCRRHHRLIHGGEWTVRLGTDELPEFIPPAHVDVTRQPRRNLYHRRT